MITKRKLMTYRREALKAIKDFHNQSLDKPLKRINPTLLANERILELTQELIDQHLLNENKE